MTIKEYLGKHPEINREEFSRKVLLQYTNRNEQMFNYMVLMDKPFWFVEHIYDIAYNRKNVVGDHGVDGTTYEFVCETYYDEDEMNWLMSAEAEEWFAEYQHSLNNREGENTGKVA